MVENDLISLDELKGGFTTMFETEFNIHSFLAPFLSNAIMIFQMYYYSDLPDLQEKYYGFFMGYIVYKLVQLLTSYYQSSYSGKIQNFYLNRNYEGMNLSYKKCLIMSVIIHVISYFPIKWIVMYIFTNTYLTKQNPEFVGGSIFKVGQYITIHFWCVLFGCLTIALSQILSLLNYDKYVTYGNIIRIVVNIIFGIFYRKKYGDDYFVRGLSYADVIGELCVAIYLIIIQHMLNPLSQDYLSFNMEIVQNAAKFENALETAVKKIPSKANPKVLTVNLINAKPDIMNVMMPVILEKTIKDKEYSDVCFVCVFGKDDELLKPIEARLKPIITL